jgi:hypothetical protein
VPVGHPRPRHRSNRNTANEGSGWFGSALRCDSNKQLLFGQFMDCAAPCRTRPWAVEHPHRRVRQRRTDTTAGVKAAVVEFRSDWPGPGKPSRTRAGRTGRRSSRSLLKSSQLQPPGEADRAATRSDVAEATVHFINGRPSYSLSRIEPKELSEDKRNDMFLRDPLVTEGRRFLPAGPQPQGVTRCVPKVAPSAPG